MSLTPLFYVVTLLVVMSWLTYWWEPWLASPDATRVWPVAWLRLTGPRLGAYLIYGLILIGGILAMLFPHRRWARALVFVALLEMAALASSFGKVNHSLHGWLSVAGIFVFLPDAGWGQYRSSRRERQSFLTVFWAAQTLLGLFYTMSGALKIYGAFAQAWRGELSAFHPHALAYLVADRLAVTNSRSMFGPLILEYPTLGWPLLWVAIYIETFALVAVFRPTLHRLWGAGLALLHLGNILLLAVPFLESMTLASLILLYSPFQPTFPRWRVILRDLPLVGVFWRFGSTGAATLRPKNERFVKTRRSPGR